MLPTLLSLPLELVSIIAENVDRSDLSRLRLTCKHLGDILESQALHIINFSFGYPINKTISKLQSLAATKTLSRGLSRSTRHLVIYPLSNLPYGSRDYEKSRISVAMRVYLFDALDVLRSLQSVTWFPGKEDQTWTNEIIVNFLGSRSSLQVLEVDLNYLWVPLPLHRMYSLREITFTDDIYALWRTEKYYCHLPLNPVGIQTYKNLAKLLALSPSGQITKLDLTSASLREIFQFLTPEVEPLRIKELRMFKSLLELDTLTVPHLRHLTCVHFLTMNISLDMNDVWLALHREKIHLREIKIDRVTSTLLEYLASYAGLTKLIIETIIFRAKSSSESDALATVFFGKPLRSHVETLEELDIRAQFRDLWCCGEHNLLTFSSCTRLRRLSVCVSEADLPNYESFDSSSDSESEIATVQNFEPNIVRTLLNMVSTHMPRLSHLVISPPINKHFHSRMPNGKEDFRYQQTVADILFKCPLACPIPPSAVVRYPTVIIWWKVFEPKFKSPSPDGAVGEAGEWRCY